ncbi:hypothetical protein [Reinekea blandensis]|nr:hypothetical protein [Reinekea blandensis]
MMKFVNWVILITIIVSALGLALGVAVPETRNYVASIGMTFAVVAGFMIYSYQAKDDNNDPES